MGFEFSFRTSPSFRWLTSTKRRSILPRRRSNPWTRCSRHRSRFRLKL